LRWRPGKIWNFCSTSAFGDEAPHFKSKSRMPSWERAMNIFYIIGVVVVVILVAGFLGVHV
jgi:hypothetical protein